MLVLTRFLWRRWHCELTAYLIWKISSKPIWINMNYWHLYKQIEVIVSMMNYIYIYKFFNSTMFITLMKQNVCFWLHIMYICRINIFVFLSGGQYLWDSPSNSIQLVRTMEPLSCTSWWRIHINRLVDEFHVSIPATSDHFIINVDCVEVGFVFPRHSRGDGSNNLAFSVFWTHSSGMSRVCGRQAVFLLNFCTKLVIRRSGSNHILKMSSNMTDIYEGWLLLKGKQNWTGQLGLALYDGQSIFYGTNFFASLRGKIR